MFTALLGIVSSVLSLIEMKEKRKYIDEKMAIEKAYYEERKKPRELRNNAVLDDCRQRLRILAKAITAELGIKNA